MFLTERSKGGGGRRDIFLLIFKQFKKCSLKTVGAYERCISSQGWRELLSTKAMHFLSRKQTFLRNADPKKELIGFMVIPLIFASH